MIAFGSQAARCAVTLSKARFAAHQPASHRRRCRWRKGDGAELVGVGERQNCRNSARASLPGRPDAPGPDGRHGVDLASCRLAITARDHRLTFRTASDAVEIFVYLTAGLAADRAVDTTAGHQRRICRIHDRIQLQRRDVRFDGFKTVAQTRHVPSAQLLIR
jgi:hypothetical protein